MTRPEQSNAGWARRRPRHRGRRPGSRPLPPLRPHRCRPGVRRRAPGPAPAPGPVARGWCRLEPGREPPWTARPPLPPGRRRCLDDRWAATPGPPRTPRLAGRPAGLRPARRPQPPPGRAAGRPCGPAPRPRSRGGRRLLLGHQHGDAARVLVEGRLQLGLDWLARPGDPGRPAHGGLGRRGLLLQVGLGGLLLHRGQAVLVDGVALVGGQAVDVLGPQQAVGGVGHDRTATAVRGLLPPWT